MSAASAQSQTPPQAALLPRAFTLSVDPVRLPAGERLGLVGAGLLFEVAPDAWVGPAVYGAATGRRGGLFVGGLELQRRWALGPDLSLVTGVALGGGGGGAAPVGGGLMVRPAVTLLRRFDGFHAGLSLSDTTFPSGQIHSRQLGLVLGWEDTYRHYPVSQVGRVVDASLSSGLDFERWLATASTYRLKGDARPLGLLGARAERRSADGVWAWGFEAAAAAQGGAAGYMEVLGSLGASQAVLPGVRLGARVSAGLGGGGGVPSGGGLMGKVALTASWAVAPGWQLGLEQGWLVGLHQLPNGRSAQLSLSRDLVPRADAGLASLDASVARHEWSASVQHVAQAVRGSGAALPFDLIGAKLNRYLDPTTYLSMQAHSAYAGGAGAYSVGLLGGGWRTAAAPDARWLAGAEALVGAAGGGGVVTGGGAIGQALLWAGAPAGPGEVHLGLGTVRALRGGGLNSRLVELSWTQAFGLAGR